MELQSEYQIRSKINHIISGLTNEEKLFMHHDMLYDDSVKFKLKQIKNGYIQDVEVNITDKDVSMIEEILPLIPLLYVKASPRVKEKLTESEKHCIEMVINDGLNYRESIYKLLNKSENRDYYVSRTCIVLAFMIHGFTYIFNPIEVNETFHFYAKRSTLSKKKITDFQKMHNIIL